MTDFITAADVNTLLGPGWAGGGDETLAVTMANAWLTAKITRPVPEPTPNEVKLAGAQIAKEAAAGRIFAAEDREVVSTSVTAGPVTTAKTFAKGSKPTTSGESFALALLAPWTRRTGTMMLRRV
ncbi:hypothetical protein [Halopseudomonas pertucinogena]|uniref:Uncharacterized protein n=1 Tax=Halopseudomonas pertucinogena TaxID=86175 RepID=A0ABQ2CRQ5_9GAMM|nr:hypothetical protein [Halopseudomonas pertucinogena]GGJ06520.1 hypothetical protein GCM10009083_24410 [Halopseudomonas pertucinogena]